MPPYAILFMADFEEKILGTFENKKQKKTMIWRRYIADYIFFIWQHGQESLNVFIDQRGSKLFRPKHKLINGELKTDLFVKPTDTLDPASSHLYHGKKEYFTVKL